MKKILLFLLLSVSILSFGTESKQSILKLIKDVEKNPAAESSISKYEKIIDFSIETEDFEIKLYPEFISLDNDNTDQNTGKILLGSYLAGVLKNSLEKNTMPKTSDGIKQELKVYKILKKNRNIKSVFFEELINAEKAGTISSVYEDYDKNK